ncbi:DUF2721 domain-containing protein [Marilutibacter maris]|uniref:DUF2721 domain-containing protein n=1 Tax=Marilutibacter maris TaxID=1605891 RepID=A0A2U9TGK5_9GAMM|nr:DUF2721 domain-containing protein [Lysobacter maris]AWV07300.1 hypothetical protein C9I47_1604 [Lysobacter maris]KAB8181817.1 DUF2721 domain-containing protein [Lysobacter maris]
MFKDAASHYAILTAMLAPAFFLTATASLLMSANNRLARVIDRARQLLLELETVDNDGERARIEALILMQRRRSRITLHGSQLLYLAISCFVGTSLTVAADAFMGYRFVSAPTILAALGVTMMLAASILLAYESSLAVRVVNDEMDHGHKRANQRRLGRP